MKEMVRDRIENTIYLDKLAQVKELVAEHVGDFHYKLINPGTKAFNNIGRLHTCLKEAGIKVSRDAVLSLKDDGGYYYRRYPNISVPVLAQIAKFIEQAAEKHKSDLQADVNLAGSFQGAVETEDLRSVSDNTVAPVSQKLEIIPA